MHTSTRMISETSLPLSKTMGTKSKSLLTSLLMSPFTSPAVDADLGHHQQHQQQQQQQHQQRPNEHRHRRLTLHSNRLPRSLLGDNNDDGTIGVGASASRSRTVTDDAVTVTMEPPDSACTSSSACTSATTVVVASTIPLLPLPRRSWKISNDDRTALPRVPGFLLSSHYYFQCKRTTTSTSTSTTMALVTDAPPSIVVVRISECLRKRSIAVEYDDESATARCMTVDRCHFEIQLYRSSSSSSSAESMEIDTDTGLLDDTNTDTNMDVDIDGATAPDGVIVEVRKLTSESNSFSFHAACRKILLAAKGLDTGDDDRPAYRRNGAEFRPLKRSNRNDNHNDNHSSNCSKIDRPAPIGRSPTKRAKIKMPSLLRASEPQQQQQQQQQVLLGSSFSSQSSSGSSIYYDSMDSFQELHKTFGSSPSPLPLPLSSPLSSCHRGESALESALELLQKDRFDCQQLGMQSLVDLTTPDISGNDISRYVSRLLLSDGRRNQNQNRDQNGSDGDGDGDGENPAGAAVVGILMKYLLHPGAEQASGSVRNNNSGSGSISISEKEDEIDRMVRSFLESSALSAVASQHSGSRSGSLSRKHTQHQAPQHLERSQSLFFRKQKTPSQKQQPLRSSSVGDISWQQQRQQQQQQQDNDDDETREALSLSPDELRHEARLRALALRVLCNALDNLSNTGELQRVLYPPLLLLLHVDGPQSKSKSKSKSQSQSTPSQSRWVRKRTAVLLSLVQDLQGAGRPPSVSEHGYKLASVHEAALAARCLRLFAGYKGDGDDANTDANTTEEEGSNSNGNSSNDDDDDDLEAVRDFLRSEPVLERLSYARYCGRTNHAVLQYEAERTYDRLTEDARSC